MVSFDRFVGSCNTLNGLSNKSMCFKQNRRVQSKRVQYDQSIYHANVNVNLMIEDVIQIRSGITMCLDASAKNIENYCIWNTATCSCKYGKYLGSIIDDSVITCDEIIDTETKPYDGQTKTVIKKNNEKEQPVKHKIFTFCLSF